MNQPGYKFITAAVLAAIYVGLAISTVCVDRKPHNGFITLQGMTSYLATSPVALPLEWCGHKINFRSNWQMGTAIGFCAGLFFAIIFGALSLVQFIWNALAGSH